MFNKKILSIPLILSLLSGSLFGCGAQAPSSVDSSEVSASKDNESTSPASESETVPNEEDAVSSGAFVAASSNESSEEETVTVKGITERSDEMRDISAAELVSEMTAGWNLGNTLEATGSKDLSSETSWGNPKITKEMIDAVCQKGFDSIRIPITFGNHMGPAPEYTIDADWMDRVEEVVNYALDDGMFVLIDSHHEEDWRIPDSEHIEESDACHIAIWTQLSKRFKDYGDHLIFEGLNEPRTKGSAGEWSGGTKEERDYVNRLNKSFVDTVRKSGGNNEKRLLLITTYGDSPIPDAMNQLEIPEDQHIAVAIHAYEPYAFTFASGESWELQNWDGSHNKDIDNLMRNLQKSFLDKGIPVLLTEYGAVNKSENTAEVRKWASAYVERATKKHIPCFWWDNGIYDKSGEKFAILNRRDLTWYREEVVDAIIKASYTTED